MKLSIPLLNVVTGCTARARQRRADATFAWTASSGAAMALLLSGCSPALDWRERAIDDTGGLVAMFPCRAAQDERRLSLGGPPLRMTLHACPQAGATWAVAHADTTDPAAVGPALQALARAARANIEASAVESVPAAVPGMSPNANALRLTLTGRLPDGTAVRQHVWLFARGTVVVQASVIGAAPPAEGLATFAEGLRFQPRPGAAAVGGALSGQCADNPATSTAATPPACPTS